MKSYTDLEQSKKLAEILPLESADMWWNCLGAVVVPLRYCNFPTFEKRTEKDIPCWSFTALLKLMPDKISINNESYYLSFTKNSVEFRGPITWDGQKTKSFEMDNILDAAFEMVCWLKENKKL